MTHKEEIYFNMWMFFKNGISPSEFLRQRYEDIESVMKIDHAIKNSKIRGILCQ